MEKLAKWSPERKIVAAAFATLIVWTLQVATGVDVIPGVEGAIGVLVGYVIPNSKG